MDPAEGENYDLKEEADLPLLGVRTLEGMNLSVDGHRKRLVAAGPIIAASRVSTKDPCP